MDYPESIVGSVRCVYGTGDLPDHYLLRHVKSCALHQDLHGGGKNQSGTVVGTAGAGDGLNDEVRELMVVELSLSLIHISEPTRPY